MIPRSELVAWGSFIVAIILGVMVYRNNVRLEDSAAKTKEEVAFKGAGGIVPQTVSKEELRELVKSTLQEEFETLRKAVPGTRQRSYAQVQSQPIQGEVKVERQPEPSPGCPLPASVVESYPVEFMAKGKALTVQGPAGAEALVGKVELWQTKPGPLRLFGEAPFDADASKLFTVAPPPEPKFHAEIRVGLDTDLKLHAGGTYYKGKKRVGFWGEAALPLDSTDPTGKTIAGGLAFRLGG